MSTEEYRHRFIDLCAVMTDADLEKNKRIWRWLHRKFGCKDAFWYARECVREREFRERFGRPLRNAS